MPELDCTRVGFFYAHSHELLEIAVSQSTELPSYILKFLESHPRTGHWQERAISDQYALPA